MRVYNINGLSFLKTRFPFIILHLNGKTNNKHPMTSVRLTLHKERSDTKGQKLGKKRKEGMDSCTWWMVLPLPLG